MQTTIQLVLRNYKKEIPYMAEDRGGGNANHGFMNLKGKPEQAASIAEVQDNEHLKRAIITINEINTPFFTVGCEKSLNQKDEIFWMRGFIEFAFNHRELVADFRNYFEVFVDFNHFIWQRKFEQPVVYSWEIEGALFRKVNSDGFSVAVWITTGDLSAAAETQRVWESAVDIFGEYLAQCPRVQSPMIYTPQDA